MAERVAVIGSRDYPDLGAVRAFVCALPAGTTVISGGARGVDREALRAALDAGLPFEQHLPDYDTYGRRAPLMRNGVIADRCDRMVAFWRQESRGTADAIRCARAQAGGNPSSTRWQRWRLRRASAGMGYFKHRDRLWAGFACARCGFVGIAGEWADGLRCTCGYLWTVKREGGAVRWQIRPPQRQEPQPPRSAATTK